jgi:hypothetical protein
VRLLGFWIFGYFLCLKKETDPVSKTLCSSATEFKHSVVLLPYGLCMACTCYHVLRNIALEGVFLPITDAPGRVSYSPTNKLYLSHGLRGSGSRWDYAAACHYHQLQLSGPHQFARATALSDYDPPREGKSGASSLSYGDTVGRLTV